MLEFLIRVQGDIQGSVTAALSGFAASRDWTLLVAMLPMGVAFGAIHALTPGHGKTILTSYLVGSRLGGLRGLIVAGSLSLTHVGSAVVISLLALPLVSRSLGGAGQAPSLEVLSRGLLALIGLWLLIRALRTSGRHSHDARNGVMVGVVAGLVPCPLTLFAMVLALSRGVPEAGLAFAGAMVGGVGFTLASVAALTMLLRDRLVDLLFRRGASIERLGRLIEGLSGLLLVVIGGRELVHGL